MCNPLVYWLWLTQIDGIGPFFAKRLLAHFGNPAAIFAASREELMKVHGIGDKLAGTIRESRSLEKAEESLKSALDDDMKLLTLHDELYPNSIRKLPDAPTVFYYKGKLKSDDRGIVISGSRNCSEYAQQVATEMAEHLGLNDITVIGGLTKGVESHAHAACLRVGGRTVAFLSHGLDITYPKGQGRLRDAIIERGAIISQFPLGTRPWPVNFSKRNYFMSAFAKKVVIVEAGSAGFALNIAHHANKLKKALYAVPNDIYSENNKGTNGLIADGARIYLRPDQLIETSPEAKTTLSRCKEGKCLDIPGANGQLTAITCPDETEILAILGDSSLSLENLASLVSLNNSNFLEIISLMHLEGKIKLLPGGFVSARVRSESKP